MFGDSLIEMIGPLSWILYVVVVLEWGDLTVTPVAPPDRTENTWTRIMMMTLKHVAQDHSPVGSYHRKTRSSLVQLAQTGPDWKVLDIPQTSLMPCLNHLRTLFLAAQLRGLPPGLTARVVEHQFAVSTKTLGQIIDRLVWRWRKWLIHVQKEVILLLKLQVLPDEGNDPVDLFFPINLVWESRWLINA